MCKFYLGQGFVNKVLLVKRSTAPLRLAGSWPSEDPSMSVHEASSDVPDFFVLVLVENYR